MVNIFQHLMDEYIIKPNESTIWEETDGCAKQYRYAIALYLMIFISLTLKIIIDREIVAPGHRKYVVDGLNERDKIYLREKINMLSNIFTTILKALVCFILTSTGKLLVLHNNAMTFL